jgi:hypothetical protein
MLDFPHAMGRCDQMPIMAIIALVALLGTVAPAQAQFERFPIIKKMDASS